MSAQKILSVLWMQSMHPSRLDSEYTRGKMNLARFISYKEALCLFLKDQELLS